MPMTRRCLLGAGVGLAASGTAGYAGGIEPYELRITRYQPAPAAWPGDRRLTMTVIADLHAGGPNMTLARIDEIIDAANALRADVIVLLGDFVATHRFVTERVPPAAWGAALSRLSAPLGVWTILGNHDWWHGIADIRQTLDRAEIPILENKAIRLGSAGQRFWLAGLGDQLAFPLGRHRFRGIDDLPGTLAQLHGEDPAILLVHEPDIFPRVPSRVALTLAGHTHGAQLRIPLIWPWLVPSKYGARFAYGHIVEQGRHLVVSGGLGTSIIPARLGVPPEIVHITLGS